MSKIQSYKNLIVYQKSLDLVVEIYRVTKLLPNEEKYGLISQMRRAAVSIPSNIAEGFKRRGINDYVRFLSFASGSAAELETHIELCKRLYSQINFTVAENLLEEVKKMLGAIIRNLLVTIRNN
jgi:four helix bundle protein